MTNSSIISAGVLLGALCAGSHVQAQSQTHKPVLQVPVPHKVQIAILLDTSSSMDGLISQAKSELWSIVNRFGEASINGVPPDVEVALYEYGKDSIPAGEGYLRMVSNFTTDLDHVSEELFALGTNGGSEYAGLVIDRAVDGLVWSSARADYRAIFIAGNEEFTQGPMPYGKAISAAGAKGIIVNTIHCGSRSAGIDGKWMHAAKIGEGSFLTIEQNHQAVQIASPFDKEIASLSAKINRTYIAYGREGEKKAKRQKAQDSNASKMGIKSAMSRARTKGGRNYKNSTWDLVDGISEGKASLGKIKDRDLPANMRKMSAKERKEFVAAKSAERKALQARIKTLSDKRKKFISAERKKLKKAEASTFDSAVLETVNKQMSKKGYKFAN